MANGSIIPYHGKNGTTWSVKYRDAEGRQVKKTIGPSKREAQRALREALAAVDHGAIHRPDRDSFADYAASWLDSRKGRIEYGTWIHYEEHIRLRLVPFFGRMRLAKISRNDVHRYVRSLEGKISAKTANNSLVPLEQILKRAVRDGLVQRNPTASDSDDPIRLPYEAPTMISLTPEEARRYLEEAPAEYRPLAMLLVGGGLRLGEALALDVDDVDWKGSTVRVTDTMKRVDERGRVGRGGPKGNRERLVALPVVVMEALREARGDRISGVLFATRRGSELSASNVRNRWHLPTLEAAGLPRFRLHDLRHTATRIWLAAGESIYFAQQQLGHKDIQTTIDRYGHPDQHAHRAAAERAGSWMKEA